MLIVGFLSLWSFPMFAQLQPTEIKVIDSENGNSIEFAAVQWKGLNAPTYTNGTTTNRNKITPISITLPQNNNLLAYKHNRGISVDNRVIYLLGR